MVGCPCGGVHVSRSQASTSGDGARPAGCCRLLDKCNRKSWDYLRGNAWQCKRGRLWTFSWTIFRIICQARRLRIKGMCSLSASRDARVGPGVGREFRTPDESPLEGNFTSLTRFPPQAWLMRKQISRFMLSSCCCHGFPSAANSRQPLWHRSGRACSASDLPTIVGQALESHAIAASGRSIPRSAFPRNSPIRSMRFAILRHCALVCIFRLRFLPWVGWLAPSLPCFENNELGATMPKP